MMVDGKLVSPDATFLRRGWHQPEDGLRWTNGLALLPPLRTLTLLLAPIMPGGDGTQCADAREIASAARGYRGGCLANGADAKTAGVTAAIASRRRARWPCGRG